MRDTELYGRILGVEQPWRVKGVELRLAQGEVEVRVEHVGDGLNCPECGGAASGYDHRERRWRHLDTCQYRTILVAEVPRVQCREHGVKTIRVPWSDPGSPFTALFEALIIDWLGAVGQTRAVARQLGLTWDEVDGVMQRAVRRGLERRELRVPRHVGVDETSFQKRHEYVTVVADNDRGVVQHVADGHGREALGSYFAGFAESELEGIRTVTMDMWLPYVVATLLAVPEAEGKIAFDKYHVAALLNRAVDLVRRDEHSSLRRRGEETLKRSRYLWLSNPDRLSPERAQRLSDLLQRAKKTSRAWQLKELAMQMWTAASRAEARLIFGTWYSWAIRSRLAPLKKAARTLKSMLRGVLNAIEHRVNNAHIEGINSRIQALKRNACGFRNRDRFRNAIYFHLGGLNLYPTAPTHSNA